jgi:hypothetical protein
MNYNNLNKQILSRLEDLANDNGLNLEFIIRDYERRKFRINTVYAGYLTGRESRIYLNAYLGTKNMCEVLRS